MATLRETWQDQCFTPLVSRVTATELIRVLAYPKFRLTRIEQDDLLATICLTAKLCQCRPNCQRFKIVEIRWMCRFCSWRW
ncbi:hypothetical protein [Leptolyngbya sp. CCNP1308]|uniref:hypothetical protein n=1 Tax=Leptolyngbya sp. CCNP1308 TaxID=3110255 RepID=UPI003A598963